MKSKDTGPVPEGQLTRCLAHRPRPKQVLKYSSGLAKERVSSDAAMPRETVLWQIKWFLNFHKPWNQQDGIETQSETHSMVLWETEYLAYHQVDRTTPATDLILVQKAVFNATSPPGGHSITKPARWPPAHQPHTESHLLGRDNSRETWDKELPQESCRWQETEEAWTGGCPRDGGLAWRCVQTLAGVGGGGAGVGGRQAFTCETQEVGQELCSEKDPNSTQTQSQASPGERPGPQRCLDATSVQAIAVEGSPLRTPPLPGPEKDADSRLRTVH